MTIQTDTSSNKPVAAALARLGYSCRNAKDITAERLGIYVEDLDDLPEGLVIQACRELERAGDGWFPAVSQLRRRVIDLAAGPVLVDPEAAWGEVLREARRVGAEGHVNVFAGGEFVRIERQFSSPLIAKAVDAIGWRDICLTDVDDLPTVRAQFRRALEAIQRREIDPILSGRAADAAAWDALMPGSAEALSTGA